MTRKYSLEPGVGTLIHGCCACLKLQRITVVYNTLLDICARTNDEERGYEIISRMEASGVEPDASTTDAVRNRKSLRSYLKKTFSGGGSSLDEE